MEPGDETWYGDGTMEEVWLDSVTPAIQRVMDLFWMTFVITRMD